MPEEIEILLAFSSQLKDRSCGELSCEECQEQRRRAGQDIKNLTLLTQDLLKAKRIRIEEVQAYLDIETF